VWGSSPTDLTLLARPGTRGAPRSGENTQKTVLLQHFLKEKPFVVKENLNALPVDLVGEIALVGEIRRDQKTKILSTALVNRLQVEPRPEGPNSSKSGEKRFTRGVREVPK